MGRKLFMSRGFGWFLVGLAAFVGIVALAIVVTLVYWLGLVIVGSS